MKTKTNSPSPAREVKQSHSAQGTKFTPGPWSVGMKGQTATFNPNTIYTRDGDGIANVYGVPLHTTLEDLQRSGNTSDSEGMANARLVSASPELYAALNDIMKCVEAGVLVRDTSRDHETGWAVHQLPLLLSLKAAQSALAKARGESYGPETHDDSGHGSKVRG